MVRRGVRPPAGPRSRPRAAVLAVLITVLFLGGSVAALVSGVPHMAYAARWEGTPGTLTVAACEFVGPSARERHHECHGVFRSDDGATLDPNATIGHALSPGTAVPVQRTHAGGYVTVGFASFTGWLSVALFGVVLAVLYALVMLALLFHVSARRPWLALAAVLATALACALTSGIASLAT